MTEPFGPVPTLPFPSGVLHHSLERCSGEPLAHEVFWRELNMNAVDMLMDKTMTVKEALDRSNKEVQRELSAAIEYQDYVISVMNFESE